MGDPGDWTDSVSMRLACLALDTRGRLTDDLVTARAVRGALLIDLALQGRVTQTDDAVEVDTSPTGFAPADLLLAGTEPARWVVELVVADVADAMSRGRTLRLADG